jgi:hypothetical protein
VTGYKPNYLMYSRPPQGWHDEPFEYVFSFSQFFSGIVISSSGQFDFFNNPLQFDPDADFFMRGFAVLVDNVPNGKDEYRLDFNMRLRNAYGRALDSGFIPMMAYATSPENLNNAAFGPESGSPVATPWYPEMYCPANGTMFADFQCQPVTTGAGAVSASYSFHLYLQGVKRFQNEECKPGNSQSTGTGKAAA